jgi:hypothetical protein
MSMMTSVLGSAKRVVAVFLAIAVVSIGGTQAAFAGDRPVGVAFVKAKPIVDLKHNGSVVVTEKIRCTPGWQSSDLSVHVAQPNGAQADGFTTTAITCNSKWHTVRVTLSDVFMKMHRGPATISSQFLVTNVETGDSAGGHDVTKGWVRPVWKKA